MTTLEDQSPRGETGRFQRTIMPWSLENFDDGYVDNRGRFRVYVPDHPRAFTDGYIHRAVVAYETYHGISVPSTMDIHHKNRNRLDDSKENLQMLSHSEHSKKQKRAKVVTRTCEHCKAEFDIKKWRLKDPSRGKFCSQKCYHAHKRTEDHKTAISEGAKKAWERRR